MTRLLPVLCGALAVMGCNREPKNVTALGYTFTVPASWTVETSDRDGYRQVLFDDFDFDGNCNVHVFANVLEPEAYVDAMAKAFQARGRTASSFKGALGSFEGAAFEGAFPSDSAMGKLAQLAGTPRVEVYALRREAHTLGLALVTTGNETERRRSRAACAAVLASMRVATPAR
jgi:hypothetical protein